MDSKQQVLRVVVYQREGKHLKYQSKVLPFLDALCSGAATSRQQLTELFDLTEDGVLTILTNVTMAIQRGGSALPMSEGGWYEGDPNEYRVNPDFAREWLFYRGKSQQ